MSAITHRSPVRYGLKDISVEEAFWNNSLALADVLQEKLNGLPVNPHLFPELAEETCVVKELLLAYGTHRYGTLSVLAFADLLRALDHFLLLNDRTPDTRIDGYKDDARVLHRVFVKHEAEINAFKDWLRAQA